MMGDYRELHNVDHYDHPGGASEQENFALYDPGPLEASDENWDSWHSDEVKFSRRDGLDEAVTCCRRCISCHRGSKRRCYLMFLCSTCVTLVFCAIIGSAIFASLTLISSSNNDPKWYESAVGYQIFPRSFQDSDGDGVGDLRGIINRLDYLEYLGIDVIWLCPIYPSPNAHIGLDITNFTGIDPLLGNMHDFQMLIKAVHKKGMKLVLEYVPNHSSIEHYWFEQSRQSRTNPYSDFYIWADGISENDPPNDWKDSSGSSNWKYEPNRKQWYHHSFLETEPSLNYDSSYVQLAMTDALSYWFDQNIDGIYIRHVNHLLGTSEIHTDQDGLKEYSVRPSSPNNTEHSRPRRDSVSSSYGSLERAKSIIQKWRKVITNTTKSTTEHKLLAVDTKGSSMVYSTSLYGTTQELPLADYPFNYALFDVNTNTQRITGHSIRYLVRQWLVQLPNGVTTNWALGNPEISRISTRYKFRFLGALTLLTLTLPGSTLLYYGDEIGMTDVLVDDIDGNRFVPYGPMLWDSTDNAGFTNGNSSWIGSVANNSMVNNVQIQKAEDSSLLNLIRRMIKLRKQEPALGNYSEHIHVYDLHSMRELIIFVRHPKKPGSVAGVLFIANIAEYEVTEDYPLLVTSTKLPDLGTVIMASNDSVIGTEVNLTQLKLLSGEAVIVKFKSE